MTTFTRTWNAAYEALPSDTEDARDGASRMRQIKVDVAERLEVDHSWAGDANDGAHKKVTLLEQASDPAPAATTGFLYTKDVSGSTELFYQDAAGNVVQISKQLPVGSIYISVVSTNPSTLLGYGTWTAFAAGRMLIGIDSGNTLFDTPEETGGSADAVNVAHTHTITDSGHAHTFGVSGASSLSGSGSNPTPSTSDYVNTGSATTGISIDSSGVSGTNANYPPFISVYMWKRTA